MRCVCLGGGDVFAPEVGGKIFFGQLSLFGSSGFDLLFGRRVGCRCFDGGIINGRCVGSGRFRYGLGFNRCSRILLRHDRLGHDLIFGKGGNLRGDRGHIRMDSSGRFLQERLHGLGRAHRGFDRSAGPRSAEDQQGDGQACGGCDRTGREAAQEHPAMPACQALADAFPDIRRRLGHPFEAIAQHPVEIISFHYITLLSFAAKGSAHD